jgi:hypothetical protein
MQKLATRHSTVSTATTALNTTYDRDEDTEEEDEHDEHDNEDENDKEEDEPEHDTNNNGDDDDYSDSAIFAWSSGRKSPPSVPQQPALQRQQELFGRSSSEGGTCKDEDQMPPITLVTITISAIQ